MYRRRWRTRLAGAGLYAVNCFIMSVVVVTGFALIARPQATSATGAVATTTIASVVSLLQGNPENIIWILIVVPWSGAFFGGGVLVSLLRNRLPSLKYFLPAVALVLASLGAIAIAFAVGT